MEPRNAGIRLRQYVIDNATWTGIYPSMPCRKIEIQNGGPDDVFLRTDKTNAASEKPLNTGASEHFEPFNQFATAPDPIVWIKSTSSTGPIYVKEIA